jgi:spore coat protein U-like protein
MEPGGPVLLSIGTLSVPYTTYGRISPLQDLPPGTYADTITVTLNYN